jgi:hypothetical protein
MQRFSTGVFIFTFIFLFLSLFYIKFVSNPARIPYPISYALPVFQALPVSAGS